MDEGASNIVLLVLLVIGYVLNTFIARNVQVRLHSIPFIEEC